MGFSPQMEPKMRSNKKGREKKEEGKKRGSTVPKHGGEHSDYVYYCAGLKGSRKGRVRKGNNLWRGENSRKRGKGFHGLK